MLASTRELLDKARAGGYAIGAFNVYNLEGVLAVVAAAEAEASPALLQIHPSALKFGGAPLIALCLEAARKSSVSIGVHLDHSSREQDLRTALDGGIRSVMVDGSRLAYADNLTFTRAMAELAHASKAFVEAELGRLTGTEDGLTVPEYEVKLTEPMQAREFVTASGVDALAVCIGNVHGHYRGEPQLDFARLAAIQQAVDVPLVLHGASGLPQALIHRAIELGVVKFNVNTEVREAYGAAIQAQFTKSALPDLLDLLRATTAAMQQVIANKMRLFGSAPHDLIEKRL